MLTTLLIITAILPVLDANEEEETTSANLFSRLAERVKSFLAKLKNKTASAVVPLLPRRSHQESSTDEDTTPEAEEATVRRHFTDELLRPEMFILSGLLVLILMLLLIRAWQWYRERQRRQARQAGNAAAAAANSPNRPTSVTVELTPTCTKTPTPQYSRKSISSHQGTLYFKSTVSASVNSDKSVVRQAPGGAGVPRSVFLPDTPTMLAPTEPEHIKPHVWEAIQNMVDNDEREKRRAKSDSIRQVRVPTSRMAKSRQLTSDGFVSAQLWD